MIAEERVPSAKWRAEFKRRGCKPAEGIKKLPHGEWWRWPWPHACPFFIPIDDDGYIETWTMIKQFKTLRELAPADWQHPPA